MPLRLLDFLNRPKYQILFYLYKYEKIATSNSRSKIMRSFGYKSSGHFYPDFNFLLDNKLVIEKKDNYVLGKEGKKELRFFSTLEIGLYLSLSLSILTFWNFSMTMIGIIIPNAVFLVISMFLLFLTYIFYTTQKTLKPELPDSVNDLKNR